MEKLVTVLLLVWLCASIAAAEVVAMQDRPGTATPLPLVLYAPY